MTQEDVLFVLDAMDDFLEQKGLMEIDEQTGEVTYSECEVDETEQLEYVMQAVKDGSKDAKNSLCHALSGVQVQLIMDAEMQYGIKQGWYEEDD
jgi:hypothetical protein